jgi:hypothetical protein
MTSTTRTPRPANRDINTLDGSWNLWCQFSKTPLSTVTVPSGSSIFICRTAEQQVVAGRSNVGPDGIGRLASLFVAAVRSHHRQRLSAHGIPVFSGIFAQDTIASSSYNSLQVSLDKRFAHGLQFTAAYTYSKSIDQASSFEGILNPLPGANNNSPSLFDAKHRFVVSYYWEVPVRKYSGFAGKVLDGWAMSGITTYQTGFPIASLRRPTMS